MKKFKKLNLKKLSVAKLDANLQSKKIKGGTDPNTDLTCGTFEMNCQTSVRTNTEFSINFDNNCPDPNFSKPGQSCVCL
ncbi:hypothetical protein [Kordia sp.]|uniref:hypothetical protein n=1 Tax=Kordia sp. TaxID=1965332 RepID=UPI0025B7C814|nr:hypothetical protein [Kordia sp.]MCH2192922.1 hypothetical protein [Kordia sp.]